MKRSPIGLNIHIGYTKDWGKLLSRLDQLQPTVNLCHIDNLDQMQRVRELQGRYPQTQFIVRMYTEGPREGDYHLPGEDETGHRLSPWAFVQQYADLGRGGLMLNAQNEPTGYENLGRLVRWQTAALKTASEMGVRLAGPAFGMGHPGLSKTNDSEWEPALIPLLKAYAESDGQHWLNLHEYAEAAWANNDYLLGRFKRMVALCDRLHIAVPDFVITEFGVDKGGPGTGYKSQGLEGAPYADWLVDAFNKVYRVWLVQGKLKGMAIFCYGNSGGWDTFNTEPDDAFWQRFLAIVPRFDAQPVKPPHSPIGDNPTSVDERWQDGWQVLTTQVMSHVRLAPDPASIPVGIVNDSLLPVRHIPRDALSETDQERSRGWYLVELPEDTFGQGRIGWVRDVVMVAPTPPPQKTDLVALFERMRDAFDRRAQADQEIALLLGEASELVSELVGRQSGN